MALTWLYIMRLHKLGSLKGYIYKQSISFPITTLKLCHRICDIIPLPPLWHKVLGKVSWSMGSTTVSGTAKLHVASTWKVSFQSHKNCRGFCLTDLSHFVQTNLWLNNILTELEMTFEAWQKCTKARYFRHCKCAKPVILKRFSLLICPNDVRYSIAKKSRILSGIGRHFNRSIDTLIDQWLTNRWPTVDRQLTDWQDDSNIQGTHSQTMFAWLEETQQCAGNTM